MNNNFIEHKTIVFKEIPDKPDLAALATRRVDQSRHIIGEIQSIVINSFFL